MSDKKIQVISIDEVLDNDVQLPIIDVRTPAEFDKGHIPGARNLPIFTNEERAQIGTVYKQKSREEAILLGLDFTGPKWSGFIRKVNKFAPQKEVIVHCWRGGMRSEAMAWALNFYGFKTAVIEGGYKSYRRWVMSRFEKEHDLLILGGLTGSHKTDILLELKKSGEQILDLEGLADHRGSAFGSMDNHPQPTQEQFENQMAAVLNELDLERRIWVEDESATIGRVRIPAALWQQMQNSKLIELQIDTSERMRYLIDEYGTLDPDFLIEATEKISRRLGLERTKDAVEAIKSGRLKDFIENLLLYYDKAYRNCIGKRNPEYIFPLQLPFSTISDCAEKVLLYSEKMHEIA